jgi:hypothetical protein
MHASEIIALIRNVQKSNQKDYNLGMFAKLA